MKITCLDRDRLKVMFESLKIGDTFIFEEKVFMKVPIAKSYGLGMDRVNAVSLESGLHYYVELKVPVLVVDCELIVPKIG